MPHTWQVENEVELDATPEQVWEAIASGPGIDSWYMGRTELEPRAGGTVVTTMGTFALESTITAWEPPGRGADSSNSRFAHRGADGPNGRFVAYEFLVQGRDNGSTVLRMVADGFLPGDNWEAEYQAMLGGGELYFRTLVEYVTHFAGRTATPVTASGPKVADPPATWARLLAELGLPDRPAVGDPVRYTPAGLPPIDGVVDHTAPGYLGVRTADALYRFIQGFFGSMVVGHHVFADPTGTQTDRAWKAWLTRLTNTEEHTMRKITAGLFVSLDGVVESPEKWHFQYFDEQMGATVGGLMESSDTMLLGRVTYQEFASYWPQQSSDVPPADHMNSVAKLVASTTLDNVDDWANSTLIQGDVAKELTRLKELPGKDIGITGSATLVRSLLREGVLDELHLLVHPIIVGTGKRLFDDMGDQVALRLAASVTFATGVVHLTYVPA